MTWRDRLIDPRSPDRRPRRAAYALPTRFTAGNTFLGFYAVVAIYAVLTVLTVFVMRRLARSHEVAAPQELEVVS
jgi:cytochrome bd-type quinol oxidase subunit 1